jgi:hypothetical protein
MFGNFIEFSMTKSTQNSISHVCFLGLKIFQQYQEHGDQNSAMIFFLVFDNLLIKLFNIIQ